MNSQEGSAAKQGPSAQNRGRVRLLGVVLAGGKSSRMGVDKATLPHRAGDPGGSSPRGQASYLEHAIARLLPLVEQVVISGRPWDGPGNVIGLPDAVAERGPAMGVLTALHYAATHRFDAVLVTPVDMPELETAHLQSLTQAYSQSGGMVCASFAAGIAEPLLAIYPLSVLAAVNQVASSPRRSLSRWLNGAAVERVRLPEAVAKNVNRPSDL